MQKLQRAFFAFVVAAGVYLCVELLSLATLRIINGETRSFAKLALERSERSQQAIAPVADRDAASVWSERRRYLHIPHPYIGTIHEPTEDDSNHWWIPNLEKGSLDNPWTVNVVVTGGSFAHLLTADGSVLADELEQLAPFEGKIIQIINLAFVANKQPQHLMAVNYLLALGVRIDLLINLDGFNEVGSELYANAKYGVFPAYPWTWVPVTKGIRSEGELRSLGNIYAYRRIRATLATLMNPFGFSATANLLWLSIDQQLERAEFSAVVAQVESNELPIFTRGPRFQGTEEDAFRLGVDLWSNSSLSLHHLAQGRGFPYFHLLQPNQYLDGSKPFTKREQRRFRSRELFRRLIPRWYPVLIQRGTLLRDQGVRFHDITAVYRDVEIEIYIDDCCHVGRDGNEIVAAEIGKIIAQHYATLEEAGRAD